jgi:hypothetical protein
MMTNDHELSPEARAFRAQLLQAAVRLDVPSPGVEEVALARLGANAARRESRALRRWVKGGMLVSTVGLAAGAILYARPHGPGPATTVGPELGVATTRPVAPARSTVLETRVVARFPDPRGRATNLRLAPSSPLSAPTPDAEQQMMVQRSLEARTLAMARRAEEQRAASMAAQASAAGSPLVVWDGDGVGTQASGWSGPEKDNKTIEVVAGAGYGKSRGLVWRAEGRDWMGFGWNWFSWWPSNAGTDITGRGHLVFQLRLSTLAEEAPPQPGGFMVSLSSSSGSGNRTTRAVRLDTLLPQELCDGAWHRVVVPLSQLFGGDTASGFDPRRVWEFDFGYWSTTPTGFVATIDDIGFE